MTLPVAAPPGGGTGAPTLGAGAGTAPAPKATLTLSTGGVVMCTYNPESYTISKTSNWPSPTNMGADTARVQYTGGEPRRMSLKLLFDASLEGPLGTVKPIIELLLTATELPPGAVAMGPAAAPPLVTFMWGIEFFMGVCTSLTYTYTMFQPDGRPMRADVDLSLTEFALPVPVAQNPTTRARTGHGTHLLIAGDSLPAIAHRAYGDPSHWRTIARANDIDNPFALPHGTLLLLPDLRAVT